MNLGYFFVWLPALPVRPVCGDCREVDYMSAYRDLAPQIEKLLPDIFPLYIAEKLVVGIPGA